MPPHPQHWIVAGVSGSGKTTLGRALAQRLGLPFLDADDFHPPANLRRMKRGVPLTDQDRAPWLARLNGLLRGAAASTPPAAAAASLSETTQPIDAAEPPLSDVETGKPAASSTLQGGACGEHSRDDGRGKTGGGLTQYPGDDSIRTSETTSGGGGGGLVLACSALKRAYRDRLAEGLDPPPRWLYLHAEAETLRSRMRQRDHFMPPALLQSQLDTLEPPSPAEAWWLDAARPIDQLVEAALAGSRR